MALLFAAASIASAADALVVRVGHAPRPELIEPIFLGDQPISLDDLQRRLAKEANGRAAEIVADPEADYGTIDKITEILQLTGASEVSVRREALPKALADARFAPPSAAGTSFLITFRPAPTFTPRRPKEMEAAFAKDLPQGLHTHHLRVRIDEAGPVGYVVVDGRADADKVRLMLVSSDQLAFVGMEPATPLKIQMLEGLHDQQLPQADQSEPPRIVRVSPDPGDTAVSATLDAIRVTFNQDMETSHSWTGDAWRPPLAPGESPRWIDARTAMYPVKLEPGRFYRIGINSKTERGFRSRAGMAADPAAVYFVTQGADRETIRLGLKPQVVRMEPQSGEGGIDPDLAELRVTFNVPMGPGFAWVGEGEHYPGSQTEQQASWSDDRKTCSLPVRLEPDWQYQLSLNGNGRTDFQSAVGVPLDPIFWTFETRKGAARSERGTSVTTPLRISVDPRIELISIIFRLAGNDEYNRGVVAGYNHDVDRWFGGRRNHPAIQLAKNLRKSHGVAFAAPMMLAIRMPVGLDTLIGETKWNVDVASLDEHFPKDRIPEFLDQARQFAQVTRFDKFFQNHLDFYNDTCDRARRVIERDMHLDWFDRFFGARPGADFRIVIAPLMGGLNIGPSRRVGDREEIYCILGVWFPDRHGAPAFSREASGVVAHEFNHSYSNPILKGHMRELEKPAKAIFPRVGAKLASQSYGSWEAMIYESMVRAAQVRYVTQYRGEFWGLQAANHEVDCGFVWTPRLVKLLDEYEKDRRRYPTIESFMPRIARFFEEESRTLPALDQKTPVALKLEPAHNAEDVSPTLGRLRVTFDRPMAAGSSWVGGGKNFPEITGKATWSDDRKTCTIPVRLKPGTTYELSLNNKLFQNFRAATGDPLDPLPWKFKTK